MKNKAIIHIGASALQIESIKCAKELGLYVIVTDINKNAPGIKFADEYHQISGNDENMLVDLALQKNNKYKIIGAYGNSDFALLSISKIHKALGINGPDYSTVKLSLDKFASKTIWIKNKISTPFAISIKNINELKMENIKFPLIIKPKDSCGSQGIKSVNNKNELMTAIKNAFNYSNEVLIEELIEGKHYDTIGIIWNNKFIPMGIGNRYFSYKPYHFPIWGHCPSDLTEDKINLAYDLTYNSASLLGLNYTPVKADLILSNNKFYIIEVAPRFHGDVFTSKMIPFSCNEQPVKNLFFLYKNGWLQSNLQCQKKIIWKAIFPKKELKDLAWLKNTIKYKDVLFDINKKISLKHVDNRTLLGFIWFEVPNEKSFMEYYNYINDKIGDYIL